MRAVIRRGQELVVDTVSDPVPEKGQVLVKTLSCGICGGDLYAVQHLGNMIAGMKRARFPDMPPPPFTDSCDMVLGHEFCAEVVDYGPGSKRAFSPGAVVSTVPMIFGGKNGYDFVGYSNDYPGGFGQYMVLSEANLLPVPNGLPADHAALTEPFSVGSHAVGRARPTKDDVFLVIGCGPVGLAVISALKAGGFGPVIAADFSPRRRELAEIFGADEIVNPAEISPYSLWGDFDVPRSAAELSVAQLTGKSSKRPVIFECAGAPGLLQTVMEGAPIFARIVVVGTCYQEETFSRVVPINKQLDLHFSFGYTPAEFEATLRRISEGQVPADAIITGVVGMEGVNGAFQDLSNPEAHAKIIVRPWL